MTRWLQIAKLAALVLVVVILALFLAGEIDASLDIGRR